MKNGSHTLNIVIFRADAVSIRLSTLAHRIFEVYLIGEILDTIDENEKKTLHYMPRTHEEEAFLMNHRQRGIFI